MFRFGVFNRLQEENNENQGGGNGAGNNGNQGNSGGGNGGNGAPGTPDLQGLFASMQAEFTKQFRALDQKFEERFKTIKQSDDGNNGGNNGGNTGNTGNTRKKEKDGELNFENVDPAIRQHLDSVKRQTEAANEKIRQLEEQNEKTRLQAEEKERRGAVLAELSNFSFANDAARDTATMLIMNGVKTGEDGKIYGGDSFTVPLKQFVEDTIKVNSYLLQTKQVTGSGAGRTSNTNHGAQEFNLEDIKPGMSREKQEAFWRRIGELTNAV